MTGKTIPPERCSTMADVRAGVDAVDSELIELLARRYGYMRAAARIKPDRSLVRDEDRKAQVIAHAEAEAAARRLPVPVIARLWDALVESSIAYEMQEWDRLRS